MAFTSQHLLYDRLRVDFLARHGHQHWINKQAEMH